MFFTCMSVLLARMYMFHVHAGAYKRALELMKLELWTVVSLHVNI